MQNMHACILINFSSGRASREGDKKKYDQYLIIVFCLHSLYTSLQRLV